MDLKLPPLGEGADSGTVVNLFVKEGDQVSKDQPILELENEKAVATIPATAAGTVTKVFVQPGDKISVGQRILSLKESGVPEASGAARKGPLASKRAEIAAPEDERAPEAEEVPEGEALPPAKPGLEPAAAPSVRKLARELGIDLARVRGSERGGRIVLGDAGASSQRWPIPPAKSVPERVNFSQWGPVGRKPLSALRQVIARRMSESWHAVPRVTQFDEADVTGLMALGKKYAAAYDQKGARLTLTAFALKVAVEALRKHPVFNTSLDESAQEIVLKEYYHLGVAVDTEAGLMVPVIRDVDKKNLSDLSEELEELGKKARERKLAAEEMKGGTFTISNQGGIGSGHFTPIVNLPEVAILGLGRGAMKALARADKIVPRLMLPLALSYDHRVIDGAAAARFMVDLVQGFENFSEEEVKL